MKDFNTFLLNEDRSYENKIGISVIDDSTGEVIGFILDINSNISGKIYDICLAFSDGVELEDEDINNLEDNIIRGRDLYNDRDIVLRLQRTTIY